MTAIRATTGSVRPAPSIAVPLAAAAAVGRIAVRLARGALVREPSPPDPTLRAGQDKGSGGYTFQARF